jgi:hypothetical protein
LVERRAIVAGDEGGPVPIAALQIAPLEARGPNDVLARLFASPFGPRAFAAWQDRIAHDAEPVYGISAEDGERMRLLLFQVADMQRQWRHGGGAMALAIGAGLAAGGVWMLTDHALPLADPRALGGMLLVDAGALGIAGVVSLSMPRDGENLYEDYLRDMTDPSIDGARVVARTEQRLFDMADASRRMRQILAPVGWSIVVASAGVFAAEEVSDPNPKQRLEIGVTSGIVGVCGLVMGTLSSMPTPLERMVELWSSDPSIQRLPRTPERPTVGFFPVRGGGGGMGVAGEF